MVEDPLVVSNPIGGSADLSMICLDLKYLYLALGLGVMLVGLHGLWVSCGHGLVIQ